MTDCGVASRRVTVICSRKSMSETWRAMSCFQWSLSSTASYSRFRSSSRSKRRRVPLSCG